MLKAQQASNVEELKKMIEKCVVKAE